VLLERLYPPGSGYRENPGYQCMNAAAVLACQSACGLADIIRMKLSKRNPAEIHKNFVTGWSWFDQPGKDRCSYQRREEREQGRSGIAVERLEGRQSGHNARMIAWVIKTARMLPRAAWIPIRSHLAVRLAGS